MFDEGEDIPELIYGLIFAVEAEGTEPSPTETDQQTQEGEERGDEHIIGEINYSDIASPPVPKDQREAILALFESKIMFGYNNAFYGPFDNVLRGDVIEAIWRAAGSPEPKSKTSAYKDSDTFKKYSKPIRWATEKKIATGFSDGTFRPNDPCTRGQIITFIWRFKGTPKAKSTKEVFKDVSKSNTFFNQIAWAAENGIAAGYSDKTFRPGKYCNRAQCATFIYRALNVK